MYNLQAFITTFPIEFSKTIFVSCTTIHSWNFHIERKFKNDGDIQTAVSLAITTDCVDKSYQLAEFHAQKGVDALMRLPDSENREALLGLMHLVLSRKS